MLLLKSVCETALKHKRTRITSRKSAISLIKYLYKIQVMLQCCISTTRGKYQLSHCLTIIPYFTLLSLSVRLLSLPTAVWYYDWTPRSGPDLFLPGSGTLLARIRTFKTKSGCPVRKNVDLWTVFGKKC